MIHLIDPLDQRIRSKRNQVPKYHATYKPDLMATVAYVLSVLRQWLGPRRNEASYLVEPLPSSLAPLPPQPQPTLAAPPSRFSPRCHPLVDSVTEEVDTYFLDNWYFENEKARKKFVAAGFSRVTCLYFPAALNDRIHFACRLLTVLFLIDGKTLSRALKMVD